MKAWKKAFALVLALVLTLSLAACSTIGGFAESVTGSKDEQGNSSQTAQGGTEQPPADGQGGTAQAPADGQTDPNTADTPATGRIRKG